MADISDRYVDQLIAAIKETAASISSRMASFLVLGGYIGLTVAATTDVELLRGTRVHLPVLNTDIPLGGGSGFYAVAPWIVVALHATCLFQLSILAAKVIQLDKRAEALPENERELVHERLPVLPYVQFFACSPASRLNTILAGLILGFSAIVFPLVLLSWIQLRFLPVHDPLVTFLHRMAIGIDIVVIGLFLWEPLRARDQLRDRQAQECGQSRIVATRGLAAAACVTFLAFSVVASIPGDERGSGTWFDWRNLDLQEGILVPELKPDVANALIDGDIAAREAQLASVSRQTFLQGRDLRFANLFHAVLPRADLRARQLRDGPLETSKLMGANLRYALMQQVLLDDADLRDAVLVGAQLQGTQFARALMTGCDLAGAQLQDAKLHRANLEGANLSGTQLQGADLSEAVLKGATLAGANLQGAILRNVQLKDADLSNADLRGAVLFDAAFDDARLHGAKLKWAVLDGASFTGAHVSDTDVDVTRANGPIRPVAADEAIDVAKNLVELACSDAYVARGIAMRALSSNDPYREPLVRALGSAMTGPSPCHPLEILPAGPKTAIVQAFAEAGKVNAKTDRVAMNTVPTSARRATR